MVLAKTFLSIREKVASLLLPMDAVRTLVNARGPWLEVQDALQQVGQSSELGYRLFGVALQQ
eukprot:10691213-Lingulodinium_polyedra.AAC.1